MGRLIPLTITLPNLKTLPIASISSGTTKSEIPIGVLDEFSGELLRSEDSTYEITRVFWLVNDGRCSALSF